MAQFLAVSQPGSQEQLGLAVPIAVAMPKDTLSADEKSSSGQGQTSRNHRISQTFAKKECLFTLVSVSLKEAAMDSPSFRASVNHLDTQLAQTEDWFAALSDSFMKVPQKLEEFSSVLTILDYLVPSFLQDSLVDKEHSLAMMLNTRKSLKKFWTAAFSVFKINVSVMEKRRYDFYQRVAHYRNHRREFLACQEKFDRYYQIHMSTSKSKDPALLYEDSLQLAEARIEYLSKGLELVEETQKLTEAINETIVTSNDLFWRMSSESMASDIFDQAQINEIWRLVKRGRAWHEACKSADQKLAAEWGTARATIRRHVATLHPPAVSPTDYRPDFINNRLLANIEDTSVEKCGYLCMKTYSEKSSKPVWVKRWAFVRNGVLGFLVLSPSLESVQETDKFGVLLCNVQYTPNEDRHFCFEVKTVDTTIVLQAETLHELKVWLKVFRNVQSRISDESDPMFRYHETASSRFPPLVSEFSAANNTSIDREITSTKTINFAGKAVYSKKLTKHLDRNEAFFRRYIVDSIGRINLPVVTMATKSALIARSLDISAPQFPTALDANIMGSVNWGAAFDAEMRLGAGPRKSRVLEADQTKQIGAGIVYPRVFPNAWIARDLQMRALFGPSVDPSEFCILSYHCLVSPNENQELRATHFITQDHLYTYIHSQGFVSMRKLPLNHFVEAACVAAKTQDTVTLTLVHGQLVMKLYLDEGVLVERKLNFLFRNLASDVPLETVDVITEILAIEKTFEAERQALLSKQPQLEGPVHFEFLESSSRPEEGKLKEINYNNTLPFLEKKVFNLPAKAVFHVLCGSESEILNSHNSMVELQFSERNLWRKSPNKSSYLVRNNLSAFMLPTGQRGSLNVNQEIEVHVENEFYCIKCTKSSLKLVFGPRVSFVTRIVIHKLPGERSAVTIYGEAVIGECVSGNFLTRNLCKVFTSGFSRHVLKEIDVATSVIGSKGKILKAVYFYGKILVAKDPYEPVSEDPILFSRFTLCRMAVQFMTADALRVMTTWLFVAVNALRTVFRSLTLHAGLIAIIVALSLSNLYLGSISTRQYWIARESGHLVKDLITKEPARIQREVYFKDVQDFLNEKVPISNESACFQAFRQQSVVFNQHKQGMWSEIFKDGISPASQRLRDKLRDISRKRNELLISLKLLNDLETEEARSEWQNWLLDELATCNSLNKSKILEHKDLNDDSDTMKLLGDYCDSCSSELSPVSELF